MLESVAPEVWSARHTLKLPGGIRLPARMTIVRLPNRELVLHSPVPIDEAMAAELAGLGPVAHIVAPNALHHLYLAAAAGRYPSARVYAAPGIAEKRKEVRVSETLGDTPPPGLRDHFEQHLTPGAPRLNEVLFFHGPSRTLLATDFLFNVRQPDGFLTKLTLKMMGTAGRLAQSALYKRMYQRDAADRRRTNERVLSWDFDRLTVSHGDPIGTGAKEAVAAALGARAE